jgi:hypothetical protein
MNYVKTSGKIVVQGRILNGHHGTIVMEINDVPIHTSGSVVTHTFPHDFNFQENRVTISAQINPMSAAPEAIRVNIDDDGQPASKVATAEEHSVNVLLNIHS